VGIDITDRKEKAMPFKSEKALYLNADKTKVLEEGDAEAAFLLVGAGSEIEDAEAAKYGLGSQAKSATKAEDKAVDLDETKDDDLSSLTKAELVERAEAAGLDSSGTKAELIERLA
jgi:hypothetical protein